MANGTAVVGERVLGALASGDAERAWDWLLADYRALIFSVINRLLRDDDDRMDAFAAVCEGLRANDLRRLRAFDPAGVARFSTWLVTVVRHLVLDWYRDAYGRRRDRLALGHFDDTQRAIFDLLTARSTGYVEAYEILRSQGRFGESFGAFLRQVRALYQAVLADAGPLARDLLGCDVAYELSAGDEAVAETPPDHALVMRALEAYPDDVRAAVLLFVVDEVPADEVARLVGWPNRKAVYNRVYRTLRSIRDELSAAPEHSGGRRP